MENSKGKRGRILGKPGGGIWLEMESMPGFHFHQTLLHSLASGSVVVCVPQEGSLCGCSEEGSECPV